MSLAFLYPSQIDFWFSEPGFTRTLDLSQLQNSRLSIAKPLVLFNRKIKFQVRVRKKIILQSIALSFKSDLVGLIRQDHRRSLNYTEDSACEDWTKHVLSVSKGWPGNEMQECKVITHPIKGWLDGCELSQRQPIKPI